VFRWQRRTARKQGIAEPLVGAISFTQRFASSLALHPQVHAVLPDGVFVAEANGDELRFNALPRPTPADLEAIAARIVRQTRRWIEQHEGPDEPHHALLATYGDAIDPRRPPSDRPFVQNPKKLAVQVEGFSLEAGRHQAASVSA
jgi:hypothetical protein